MAQPDNGGFLPAPPQTPAERMRGIISPPIAIEILTNLTNLIANGEVRLVDFANNVYTDSGLISLKWEALKRK